MLPIISKPYLVLCGFFLQPVFTAGINLFVFGNLAGIGPAGVPGFLFYLSGYFMAIFPRYIYQNSINFCGKPKYIWQGLFPKTYHAIVGTYFRIVEIWSSISIVINCHCLLLLLN